MMALWEALISTYPKNKCLIPFIGHNPKRWLNVLKMLLSCVGVCDIGVTNFGERSVEISNPAGFMTFVKTHSLF